ncbi:hypothetical protein AYO20_02371 [Fonsecaea nubica]|uniref:Uncharacterized protein n=1 Tax=Fonsecaea nubica TaxID=856822 RepID=A0A178D9M7_9EURO|nr:hypothetical protein AYO20_02371 [Fonsecaea nubica]OAL38312.1 hypothetical protein AYO20_02371 [Fonsecaea nubica]
MADRSHYTYRANIARRRTREFVVRSDSGPNGQHRTASGRHAGDDYHGETHARRTVYEERIVIDPVPKKPPVPPKKPHLIKKPAVVKAGTSGVPVALKLSGLWGSGEELTVGRFPSGGLFLDRKVTRYGKPPPVRLPPSDSSSDSN